MSAVSNSTGLRKPLVCKLSKQSLTQHLLESNSFHVQFQLTALSVAGHFVHRDLEMEAIERHLLPTQAQAGRKIHVLYGLGGIGKTQLAIAHARKHQHTYSAIVQVDGNSKDTVLQSLSAFGRHAAQQAPNIEAKVTAVLRWLALEGNSRWLMIFDNVDRDVRSSEEDDQAFDVESFLPPADHGSVLITTRRPFLKTMGQSTEVERLKLDQAQELLIYHCKPDTSSHGRISVIPGSKYTSLITRFTDMTKLIQRLGYLPLALVQAGTYMHRTKTNCSKYLELYEASWNQLVAKTPPLEDYGNGSIQTTWMISYERLRKENLIAGKLLQLWGHLDHQDVWYELFPHEENGRLGEYGWLQELAGSEIDFKSVMQSLLDYSLIESHGDKEIYSMHPVVHDWCTETISSGQVDMMLSALKIVGSASLSAPTVVKDSFEYEYKSWYVRRRVLERLLPHARRCVRQIDDLQALRKLESVDASFALFGLGRLFDDRISFVAGEKMYRLALHGFEQAGDPDHLSTVDTLLGLGDMCQYLGKHAEAEKMYLRVLGEQERIRGPDHETTIRTVSQLGNLYMRQGKYAEAENMYLCALGEGERIYSADHRTTIATVSILGDFYRSQGQQAKAEESYRRALVGFEKEWGPDYTTFNAVLGLGCLYQDQGSHAEAEEMYQRGLNALEKAPRDSGTVVDIADELGKIYIVQGKRVEAEKLYQRLLDEFEKTPDFERDLIGRIAFALSKLYVEQGKHVQAEEMSQRAIDEGNKAKAQTLKYKYGVY